MGRLITNYMNLKTHHFLFYLSISVLFSMSFPVFAEDAVAIGGPISIGDDGEPNAIVDPESILANLKMGKLSYVKTSLDSVVIEDAQKDKEIREILDKKERDAENAYQHFLELYENAEGDLAKLREAKAWLTKATNIWTDNPEYMGAENELNDAFMFVESGRYEVERTRIQKELEIRKLIKEAKVCNTDNDCVRASFNCFEGCGTAINQSKLKQLNKKVDAYLKETGMACTYDCYSPASLMPKCVDKVCKLVDDK